RHRARRRARGARGAGSGAGRRRARRGRRDHDRARPLSPWSRRGQARGPRPGHRGRLRGAHRLPVRPRGRGGVTDRAIATLHLEAEPVDERAEITYSMLLEEVVKAANGLKALGVGKATPVGIYMGMGPGLPVAMLACARLGAPHTVVFGGFSAEALSDRLNDMRCEVLLTQDESWRRGQIVPLKLNADEALAQSPTVKDVVVLQRTGDDVAF